MPEPLTNGERELIALEVLRDDAKEVASGILKIFTRPPHPTTAGTSAELGDLANDIRLLDAMNKVLTYWNRETVEIPYPKAPRS